MCEYVPRKLRLRYGPFVSCDTYLALFAGASGGVLVLHEVGRRVPLPAHVYALHSGPGMTPDPSKVCETSVGNDATDA